MQIIHRRMQCLLETCNYFTMRNRMPKALARRAQKKLCPLGRNRANVVSMGN